MSRTSPLKQVPRNRCAPIQSYWLHKGVHHPPTHSREIHPNNRVAFPSHSPIHLTTGQTEIQLHHGAKVDTFLTNLVQLLDSLDQALVEQVDGWKRWSAHRRCSREEKRRRRRRRIRVDRTTSAPQRRRLDQDRTSAKKSHQRKAKTVDSAARRCKSNGSIARRASSSESVPSDG